MAAVFLLLAALASTPQASGSQGEMIHWSQVSEGQVKIDDNTPLAWNVYQPVIKNKKEKKKLANLVLILLGHRYLMLDLKARLVYEIVPGDLHASGSDWESGDLAAKSRVIPSSDWSSRNVGPAELYRLTLGDYGRELQVSLPHLFLIDSTIY